MTQREPQTITHRPDPTDESESDREPERYSEEYTSKKYPLKTLGQALTVLTEILCLATFVVEMV